MNLVSEKIIDLASSRQLPLSSPNLSLSASASPTVPASAAAEAPEAVPPPSTLFEPAQPAGPDTPANRRARAARPFLQQLTETQRHTLFGWLASNLSIPWLVQRIAEPAPTGFGLAVGITTLQRLRTATKAGLLRASLTEFADTAHDLAAENPALAIRQTQAAVLALMTQHALQLAQSNPESEAFFRLVGAIERLSSLDLQRQSLHLRQERLAQPPRPQQHQVALSILPQERPLPQPPIPVVGQIADSPATPPEKA